MKTKQEYLSDLTLVEILIKEIKDEFTEATKKNKNTDKNLNYNTRLINRNRIMANRLLKGMEQY